MKKPLLLKLFALVAAMMCALGASAYSFQTGGIYYNITSQPNRTVEVTYMDDDYYSLGAYDGNITIPGTVTYNGYIYTVTRIGDRAFYNADGLTSLTIPSTVLSIGELAFCWQEDHYCNRLTSITIPNSVQTIANEAFRKCYALQTVVIGDGVTSIGESAFSKCIGLTSVTIGRSVKSIGANAFWGAGYDPDVSSSNPSGLTISIKRGNPPTIQSTTFPSKTYSYATLKVPSGTKSTYQSAYYWKNFINIQEFYTLENAVNFIMVGSGSARIESEGDYPWIVMQDSGGLYAQSGNAGVPSSTSEMTAIVRLDQASFLSFDFKAWGEGSNYDVCRFLIDGVEQFKYGARDNDWETYSAELSAGDHTLTWSYSKDGSVNPTGDYFAVDNVFIVPKLEAYACYKPSNNTLTFYYDRLRSTRSGTTYDLNTGDNYPGWYSDNTKNNVTKVVFDPSFADAKPTTTCAWFRDMTRLQTITGLYYLNTSQVTSMKGMFAWCDSLQSVDVSSFNTANVTDMIAMFAYCEQLSSLNLSHFSTSNVTLMSNMFVGCHQLTSLDVSSFNTDNVTNMYAMFGDCPKLTSLNLSGFNTDKVTNMSLMFLDCSQLQTIYVGDGWSTAAVANSSNMFWNCICLVGGQGTTYDASHIDKTYAHIDYGTSNPGYFTEKEPEAYACYTPSNTTLTFYYDSQRSSRTGTTYDLNTDDNDPDWDTDGTNANVTKVVFDPSFAGARPTTTYDWFYYMQNLESITGMSYLNTSEVTDMRYMFQACSKLTSLDVSHFNTSKVINMSWLFGYCYGLTSLDLSSFNTANVTEMKFMFYYCDELRTIYVGSGWSTAAVTNSVNMFNNCTSLVGGKGTIYDANHIDKTYAHIDGGPSNPGYFTDKNAGLRGDVNNDQKVDINDVTALINYVLTGNATGVNMTNADCDLQGNVDINDVTALINFVLKGAWN